MGGAETGLCSSSTLIFLPAASLKVHPARGAGKVTQLAAQFSDSSDHPTPTPTTALCLHPRPSLSNPFSEISLGSVKGCSVAKRRRAGFLGRNELLGVGWGVVMEKGPLGKPRTWGNWNLSTSHPRPHPHPTPRLKADFSRGGRWQLGGRDGDESEPGGHHGLAKGTAQVGAALEGQLSQSSELSGAQRV